MTSEADKYEVLEKIGHGSFGIIRKVRRKADSLVMCRKEISYLKMSQKEREQLHAEFQILSTLRHQNIVGYYHREHLKSTQDLHLYMEYCGNGDLGRVIRDLAVKGQRAQESFVWSIFSQLVTALYRCHYGIDPPEVGSNVLGLFSTASKPKTPPGTMTILHRDLKPENVFLGEDNSVKLGDFGLSKMIQSHDFASTYVGTPFYMSPEICAAEKYTLKSDIWSLGCIIYELCAREPPFNAKSHFQLVQKIKEGKVSPLPSCYSSELMGTIKDCLRVNPDHRPDTAQLLNLPVVRLMRKEREVVELNKVIKAKEDTLARRVKELEEKTAAFEADKAAVRQEVDSSLRREWEVKARLEIDRQINSEIEALRKRFESEVQSRVEAELQRKTASMAIESAQAHDLDSSLTKSEYPRSSVGNGSVDEELSTSTDLTDISTESPIANKKATRTPFGRAQTMFVGGMGTPMDIEMASPSPINIASLSLSPRRTAATRVPNLNSGNIFSENAGASSDPMWDLHRDTICIDSDDEDVVPSPTRNIKSRQNPFTSKDRPVLTSQKSVPISRVKPQFSANSLNQNKTLPTLPNMASNPDLGRGVRERGQSPSRRLSKIPSAANLMGTSGGESPGGLSRKNSTKKDQEPLGKLAAKNNIKGRTLVELQQARAGGRPLSAVMSGGENLSPKRAFKDRIAERRASGGEPAAVWDPERDEMPSPFLVRRKPMARV
ncbi:G2-specific protein kinase nim-1 [Colletotrichum tanaceti]|uniref:non-specific serine/threonine protein kinase n=1 Tax=Colletotrichum tanaceti TaxID=1306861 RepID=A0A4V6Y9E2_9PEZI|nr:G2-specific protein kinase nim-1 [Colletotrichum tanaceti]KAJ0167165.1 G2-specific protein kinase nim-1 [Colletotrichum tanaceti]TKW52006.1 G2-specific protein kinase nim-1 [Colletotrichum tanaceti]